jgi:hypothetical protein
VQEETPIPDKRWWPGQAIPAIPIVGHLVRADTGRVKILAPLERCQRQTHARLTASEPDDAAGQHVAFLAADPRIGTLPEARPSGVRPQDRRLGSSYRVVLLARAEGPPPQRRHQATASPLRHRRHDVGALVVIPAGPAAGRAVMSRRAGHRDTP